MGWVASAIWDVLTAACGSLWGCFFPPKTGAEQKVNDLNDTVTALVAEAKAAAEAPADKQSLIDTLKAGKIAVLVGLALSLASCTSPVAVACPQPRQWSPSQQDEIAANLATLPQDSPLIGALVEGERLRLESKACLEE